MRTITPGLADLDAATERTAAVLADPDASFGDREAAAEREAALYEAFPDRDALAAHEAQLEEPEAG